MSSDDMFDDSEPISVKSQSYEAEAESQGAVAESEGGKAGSRAPKTGEVRSNIVVKSPFAKVKSRFATSYKHHDFNTRGRRAQIKALSVGPVDNSSQDSVSQNDSEYKLSSNCTSSSSEEVGLLLTVINYVEGTE